MKVTHYSGCAVRVRGGLPALRRLSARRLAWLVARPPQRFFYTFVSMKYVLFLLLLGASALPSHAQVAPATRTSSPDQYCTVIARGAHYGALQFQLDQGQLAEGPAAEQAKQDRAALKELFSVADMLNYLSNRGWELVSVSTLMSEVNYPEASTVRSVGGATATFRSEVQYLLRRRGK